MNRPDATGETPRDAVNGYVGSFHVFGHGGCWGDVGHCEVRERRAYDPRPAHPLTPMTKHVIASPSEKEIQAVGLIPLPEGADGSDVRVTLGVPGARPITLGDAAYLPAAKAQAVYEALAKGTGMARLLAFSGRPAILQELAH